MDLTYEPGDPVHKRFTPDRDLALEMFDRLVLAITPAEREAAAMDLFVTVSQARPLFDHLAVRAFVDRPPEDACVAYLRPLFLQIAKVVADIWPTAPEVPHPWRRFEVPIKAFIRDELVRLAGSVVDVEIASIEAILRHGDPAAAIAGGQGGTLMLVLAFLGLGDSPPAIAGMWPEPTKATRAQLIAGSEQIPPAQQLRLLKAHHGTLRALETTAARDRAIFIVKGYQRGYAAMRPGTGFAHKDLMKDVFMINNAASRASRVWTPVQNAWWVAYGTDG